MVWLGGLHYELLLGVVAPLLHLVGKVEMWLGRVNYELLLVVVAPLLHLVVQVALC